MKKYLFVLYLGVLYISSYGQSPVNFKPGKYAIAPEIPQQLKKYVFVDTGTLKGAMQIEVTWDDNPTFSQKNLDCYTYSSLRNDTIYITGYMIGQLGWGFQLALFGDSCIISSYALSDGDLYKYNISDSKMLSFISLPSITQKLTLSAKPAFSGNERVAGFVELKSKDFYYIMGETPKKSNIKLTAFFKTAIIRKS